MAQREGMKKQQSPGKSSGIIKVRDLNPKKDAKGGQTGTNTNWHINPGGGLGP